jgi:hypothetical protein
VNDESERPPPGYREPTVAWAVEYSDRREPGSRFQSGAFTTKVEAQTLLDRLLASGSHGECGST